MSLLPSSIRTPALATLRRHRAAFRVLLPCACGLVASAAWGQAPAAGRTDGPRLQASVDSLLTRGMARLHIPGAAVVLVVDGRVVVQKGYGYADLARRTAVDAERTLFGLSSVSKPFTALAALQLAGQGRLDLDADVNRSLSRLRVDDAFGTPVTLTHLLTHTAGFDDRGIGVSSRTAGGVQPLGAYLARHLPRRVMPPGKVASYSNHGFALAGLLVEEAARVPFAAYVAEHVFHPLQMRRSSFQQPLPAELEPMRAVAYTFSGGTHAAVPRIYFNDAPASGMFSTAGDMSRFILASVGASPGIDPAVLAQMQRRQFGHHAALPGLTFGYRERLEGGHRVLEQGGDWQDYSSSLVLVPGARAGMFVAFSSGDGSAIADSLRQLLVRALGPGATAAPAPAPGAPVDLRPLEGTYLANRHSRRTFAKLGILTGAIGRASARVRGGALQVFSSTYHSRGAGVLADSAGRLVAWRTDASGRVTHLFAGNAPYIAFSPLPWHLSPVLHAGVLLAVIVVLVTSLAAGRRVWRPEAGRDPEHAGRERAGRRLGLATAALGLVFLVGAIAALVLTDPWEFQYGVPMLLELLLVLPLLLALATPLLAVHAVRAVRQRLWRRGGRLLFGAHLFAMVSLLAFAWYWNLHAFGS